MGDTHARMRSLAQGVAAMELLSDVAGILTAEGITVMPLKGAWMHLEVLDDLQERPLTDVDALVQSRDFERAAAALRAAGFAERRPDPRQAVFRRDMDVLPLDLHRELFTPGSFRLCGADMLARSPGKRRFRAVELALPDPLDAFAHLVGHATRCRLRPADRARMGDFERVGRALTLDPRAAASHLERCGMRRAARYVFGQLSPSDAPFCHAVLAALAPDPLGDALATACRWVVPKMTVRRPLGGVVTFLLEDTLARAAIAAGRQTAARLRTRSS